VTLCCTCWFDDDDSNMQKLIAMMDERDTEMVPCDIKFINWEKLFMEIHIPGVKERKKNKGKQKQQGLFV